MTETAQETGDGYIAVRKADLAQAIRAAGGAPDLTDLFRLLSAVLHYEAHDRLEALKALYDPLDADAPVGRRNSSPEAFAAFEKALCNELARANFTEINLNDVVTQDATRVLTGLKIKASQSGIRRIRYFARGARPQNVEGRKWLGLRKHDVEAQVYSDVIVLVGFKSESEILPEDRKTFAQMRRGIRPGATLVKHFRNVAGAELVTLHPGATPAMRTHDQVFLAVPAIAGGVPVLMNLWTAATVLFAVIGAYFGARGAVDNDAMARAVGALSGLVAVGAFIMRQRLKFEAQRLKYQQRLANTVYFRNIANNAGVLDLLIGAGEEQDAKEAMLAFWTLTRANTAMTRDAIDAGAERFLRDTLKLSVNFEIGDALSKLERLGLVTREGEAYRAIAPSEALTKLDAAWDAYFKFDSAGVA